MGASGECRYVFDPEEWAETRGRPCDLNDRDLDADGNWSCPHPAREDSDYCLFHRPPAEKRDREVTAALLRRVNREVEGDQRDRRRRKQFVGARFGDLSLRYTKLLARDNFPVDLRYAEVEGDLRAESVRVAQPLWADGLTVHGTVDFVSATFDGETAFESAVFEDEVAFAGAAFAEETSFRDAEFRETAHFRFSTFEGLAGFESATFRAPLDAGTVTFGGTTVFEDATFAEDADFDFATFDASAYFTDTVFGGRASFSSATFGDPVYFSLVGDEVDDEERETRFERTADFEDAVFADRVTFAAVAFEDRVTFADATFESELEFDPEAVSADEVTLRGGTLAGGLLAQPTDGEVCFDLREATLGDVRLRSGGDAANLFAYFRIEETDFDGFDFATGAYREALAASDWQFHETGEDGPESDGIAGLLRAARRRISDWLGASADSRAERLRRYSALEATYLKAKNGATDVGDDRTAAEFFRKEMYYRRRQYAVRLLDRGANPGDRIRAGVKWVENFALDATAGYGERPSRVLFTSLLVVAVGALAFSRLWSESHLPYEHPVGYLILSIESFVTLVLAGGAEVSDPWTRLFSELVGFAGVFLAALFVFTLTRSIHR